MTRVAHVVGHKSKLTEIVRGEVEPIRFVTNQFHYELNTCLGTRDK